MTDIKRLPSMQIKKLEKVHVFNGKRDKTVWRWGGSVEDKINELVDGYNTLLSELTKKPTVNKSKDRIRSILKEDHRYLYHRLDGKLVLTDETEFEENVRIGVERLKVPTVTKPKIGKDMKYTIAQIKKLPCMKMEEENFCIEFGGMKIDYSSSSIKARNKLKHQLLEELRGEGKE